MRLDLDAIAVRVRRLEAACPCRCTAHGELATLLIGVINEDRLLREQLDLEERAHQCARSRA